MWLGRRGRAQQEAIKAAKATLGQLIGPYLELRAKGSEFWKALRPKSLREVTRYLERSWRPLHGEPVDKITRQMARDRRNEIDSGLMPLRFVAMQQSHSMNSWKRVCGRHRPTVAGLQTSFCGAPMGAEAHRLQRLLKFTLASSHAMGRREANRRQSGQLGRPRERKSLGVQTGCSPDHPVAVSVSSST